MARISLLSPFTGLNGKLAVLLLALSTLTLAASSSSSTATTPTATAAGTSSSTVASIYPGGTNWAYVGCYNETTLYNNTNGQRALNGGLIEAQDQMTVERCLNYCRGNGYAYAGLEYTRECYCAQYLSSLSTHLPDSSCSLPCAANSSEICGGYLALSVYKAKAGSAQGVGVTMRPDSGVGSVLALGIALAVALAWA